MQRMRRNFPGMGLILALLVAAPASAELIQQPGGRAYPDLAGAISGTQDYTYTPASQSGVFQVTNTPFLLATGPTAADEATVEPDADGIRTQLLRLRVDKDGHLVRDPNNTYAVYGTVVVGGQTFSGLLLEGKPTAFGAQGGASAAFNLDLKVTGGALAQRFGPDLYLELHPAGTGEFDGSFAKSFTTVIGSSSTLGYRAPTPQAVPEPTTLVVLLACGAWLLVRRLRRRFPGGDFGPASGEAVASSVRLEGRGELAERLVLDLPHPLARQPE